MENQTDNPRRRIGVNIRAIRLRLRMTQQQLADACGLSKGMISKVETGAVVPALATLSKIAGAMHVKVSQLIETDAQPASTVTINPFSDENRFVRTAMGYWIYMPTAGQTDRVTQPLMIFAREGEVRPHRVTHPGEEYIFVFDGEMTFAVGEANYLLRRGDSLFFDSLQPHGISSVAGKVEYVNIFVGHHYDPDAHVQS